MPREGEWQCLHVLSKTVELLCLKIAWFWDVVELSRLEERLLVEGKSGGGKDHKYARCKANQM